MIVPVTATAQAVAGSVRGMTNRLVARNSSEPPPDGSPEWYSWRGSDPDIPVTVWIGIEAGVDDTVLAELGALPGLIRRTFWAPSGWTVAQIRARLVQESGHEHDDYAEIAPGTDISGNVPVTFTPYLPGR